MELELLKYHWIIAEENKRLLRGTRTKKCVYINFITQKNTYYLLSSSHTNKFI
jgi:hypothetical protein